MSDAHIKPCLSIYLSIYLSIVWRVRYLDRLGSRLQVGRIRAHPATGGGHGGW
jgi:hypothetical protein